MMAYTRRGFAGETEMPTDLGDLPRLHQSHVRPGLPRVGALVDPVAVGDVAADRELAASHVHDIGIRFAHRDRADRPAEILVAHRRPRLSAVGGLEDPAAGGAHVVLVGPGGRAGHGHRAAAPLGADAAPGERPHRHGVDSLRRERRGEKKRNERAKEGNGERAHGLSWPVVVANEVPRGAGRIWRWRRESGTRNRPLSSYRRRMERLPGRRRRARLRCGAVLEPPRKESGVPSLTIKGIPQALLETLRKQAKENNRSRSEEHTSELQSLA